MKYDITITSVQCADEEEAAAFAEGFWRSLPQGVPWGTMTWEEQDAPPVHIRSNSLPSEVVREH